MKNVRFNLKSVLACTVIAFSGVSCSEDETPKNEEKELFAGSDITTIAGITIDKDSKKSDPYHHRRGALESLSDE